MEQYYYVDSNNEQRGPVPVEQLNEYGITRETLVWKEGMGQRWKPAGEIPELQFLFLSHDTTPPPHEASAGSRKPLSHQKLYILVAALCCLLAVLAWWILHDMN